MGRANRSSQNQKAGDFSSIGVGAFWIDIYTRILGVLINPVKLSGEQLGKVVYVVHIPQSPTAHQALIEEGLVWEVTHCGVTLTFTKGDLFEEGDRIMFEGDDEIDIFIFDIGIHEDT